MDFVGRIGVSVYGDNVCQPKYVITKPAVKKNRALVPQQFIMSSSTYTAQRIMRVKYYAFEGPI